MGVPRRPAYPIWNPRSVFACAVVVVIVSGVLAFVLGPRGMIERLEIALGVFAACEFLFLFLGLYFGIRFERTGPDAVSPMKVMDQLRDGISDVSSNSFGNKGSSPDIDFGDDPASAAIGCFLWIFVTLGLAVLIVLFAHVFVVVLAGLVLAVYWVCHEALIHVFRLASRCEGNWLQSLKYASWYTVLYTAWAFGVLLVVKHF